MRIYLFQIPGKQTKYFNNEDKTILEHCSTGILYRQIPLLGIFPRKSQCVDLEAT